MNVSVTLPDGTHVEGVPVLIDESTERWSDVKLVDGTHCRIKLSVLSAVRANTLDAVGNPVYSFDMSPQIVVVYAPDHLKQPISSRKQ